MNRNSVFSLQAGIESRSMAEPVDDTELQPLVHLVTEERKERVALTIKKLPKEERRIISSYYGFGGDPKTLANLAEKSNITRQGMAKRLHRAEDAFLTILSKMR